MKTLNKILELQNDLKSDTISETDRELILKKIAKLKKKFLIIEERENEHVGLVQFFVSKTGKTWIVDNGKIVHEDKVSFFPNKHFLSFLIAFTALILIFNIFLILNIKGVITDVQLLAASFTLRSAGVILNIWTIWINPRNVFNNRLLMILLILSFIINFGGAVRDWNEITQ